MEMPSDFEVTEIWITEKGNLVICYRYTQNGKELARMITPEYIGCPPQPPGHIESIWD